MVFGTLHTAEGNARSTAIKIVAKANSLDLDIKTHEFPITDSDYLLNNKLGKVPTFVGADGYVLSECIAIAIYRMSTLPFTHSTHPPHTHMMNYTYINTVIPVRILLLITYSQFLIPIYSPQPLPLFSRPQLTRKSHLPEREDHAPRKDQARLRLYPQMDVLRQR